MDSAETDLAIGLWSAPRHGGPARLPVTQSSDRYRAEGRDEGGRASGVDARAAAAGLAALDAMPFGVLCLAGDLRLLLANATARAFMSQPDGPLRLRAGNRVIAAHDHDVTPFGHLVAAAAAGAPGGAIGLSTPGRPAERHAAVVAPWPLRSSSIMQPGSGAATAGHAMVFVRMLDRAEQPPGVATLQGVFGLTRTEAEVARELAGGASKSAVAAARNRKESTVRTQARGILQKTGAADLGDFKRMVGLLTGFGPSTAA